MSDAEKMGAAVDSVRRGRRERIAALAKVVIGEHALYAEWARSGTAVPGKSPGPPLIEAMTLLISELTALSLELERRVIRLENPLDLFAGRE